MAKAFADKQTAAEERLEAESGHKEESPAKEARKHARKKARMKARGKGR